MPVLNRTGQYSILLIELMAMVQKVGSVTARNTSWYAFRYTKFKLNVFVTKTVLYGTKFSESQHVGELTCQSTLDRKSANSAHTVLHRTYTVDDDRGK